MTEEASQVKNATQVDGVRTDAMEMLQELQSGNLLYELSVAIDEVLDGVKETGKKGSVKLVLEFHPMTDVNEFALKILPDVDKKVPRLPMKAETRFMGKNGGVTKHDPTRPFLPSGRDWVDNDVPPKK